MGYALKKFNLIKFKMASSSDSRATFCFYQEGYIFGCVDFCWLSVQGKYNQK